MRNNRDILWRSLRLFTSKLPKRMQLSLTSHYSVCVRQTVRVATIELQREVFPMVVRTRTSFTRLSKKYLTNQITPKTFPLASAPIRKSCLTFIGRIDPNKPRYKTPPAQQTQNITTSGVWDNTGSAKRNLAITRPTRRNKVLISRDRLDETKSCCHKTILRSQSCCRKSDSTKQGVDVRTPTDRLDETKYFAIPYASERCLFKRNL